MKRTVQRGDFKMPEQEDFEYYASHAADQGDEPADDHGVKFYDKNN